MRIFACSALALCAIAAPAQTLDFAEVTVDRGLLYSGNCGPGCAVAVGDYNDDGWEDVLLIGRGNNTSLALFRNVGGHFVDASATDLPDPRPRCSGAIFCDLDGDGDQDLALARWHANTNSTSFFALENRDGRYVRRDGLAPVGERYGKLAGLTAGDIDRDGLPEVILLRPSGGCLIDNLGDWNFVDTTEAAGLSLQRDGLVGNWSGVLARFSSAARLDLHVAIDYGPDVHAHNDGAGGFTDQGEQVGTGHVGNDMGVAVSDVDNDGDLDIFSTNIFAHTLYINDGSGQFSDEATPRGASDPVMDQSRWGYGCTFADLDLDGDEDLVTMAVPGAGTILLNDGTGHFAPAEFTGVDLHGYGLVALDFDRDGDLDLLTTHASVPPRLFERVGTPDGNWLGVRLRGRSSAVDGLGARVHVVAGGQSQMREIFNGDSFYSSRGQRAHFGLGPQTGADVTVVWPSGLAQRFAGVAANQTRIILEPRMHPDGGPVGDLDDDCDVDLDDLLVVLTHFGSPAGSAGDTDGDADTDLGDLADVLSQFGTTCR